MINRNEIKYERHADISLIKDMLTQIGDERTAIVAPSYGDSNKDKRNDHLRVYSYGSYIMDLSTRNTKKPKLFPGDGWEKYGVTKKGAVPYSEIDRSTIETAINIAKEKTKDESSKKTYEERSVETHLIIKNRMNNYGDGIVIDMEFKSPEAWIKEIAHHRGKSKTGKPDLIVYDKKDKSFGLIELKYQNKSTNNMDKHFADFYNIIHSDFEADFKNEFVRRINYLMEYKLIENVPTSDLEEAINNPIWNAFIFVEGNKTRCYNTFINTSVDAEHINKDEVGYQYVSGIDCDIDFSKKAFFKYLKDKK